MKIFKKFKAKKMKRELDHLLSEAMLAQRKGDIRRYAELTEIYEQGLVQLEIFKNNHQL